MLPVSTVAKMLGVTPQAVTKWLKRGDRISGNRRRAANGIIGWYSGGPRRKGVWRIDESTLPEIGELG